MICPSCGFENIQGADECENCGADLRTADIPAPGTAFEAKLVGVPLSEVHPHLPITIASTATAADAIRQMQEASVGCLIVLDGGTVRGILSERDLVMKSTDGNLDGTPVSDLMTADPVVLRADDSVAVAIHNMAVGGFRHIPLVTDGHATGIVSARDLFRYILDA
ncbi:MAG: CBS domain-containing protein, partial [Chloroflexota bacterium]